MCQLRTNPVRLIDLVRFFLPILPEIETPDERISLDEKIIFTIGSAIIFLVSQLPLYGLVANSYLKINDPFSQYRSIFALEKGTLLELGLLPIVTSAFLWQVAVGLRLVKVNLKYRVDRELYQTGQKLTSLILAALFGVGLILSGYYDNVIHGFNPEDQAASKPYGTYALLLVQIVGWNFLVGLLIEIFDKGYGFGSGILSFTTLQVGVNFVRDIVGLEVVPLANDKYESHGAIINFVKNVSFDVSALWQNVVNTFTREQLPNLAQVLISLATILVTIGLQNFRIELPIRSTKVRGMANVFPIRLLYTGALPLFYAFTVLANIQVAGYFLTKAVHHYFPEYSFAIGQWTADEVSANLKLTGGLLYYFSAPSSLTDALLSPIRVVVYSLTIIILSTWFANLWSKVSGSSAKEISQTFKEQGISISGKRDVSVAKDLGRIIPVASVSGAFLLSALAIATQLVGGYGRGVGIVIGVSSAFGVLEEFMTEYQQAGGASQLSNVFAQK